MGRALLPIALIALLFAPWFNETQNSEVLGEDTTVSYSAYQLLKPTVSCALDGNYSPVGECAPKGGFKGYVVLALGVLAALAGAVHLVGFMPIIRKFGSSLAALAGLAGIGGAGWIGWDAYNSTLGQDGIGLGAYGTIGAALVTTLAGWMGMHEEGDA